MEGRAFRPSGGRGRPPLHKPGAIHSARRFMVLRLKSRSSKFAVGLKREHAASFLYELRDLSG
jgi:hypothetical protein